MSLFVAGLGTAVPCGSMRQERIAEVGRQICCETPEQVRALNAIYQRAGVAKRHSVLLDPCDTDTPQTFYQPRTSVDDAGPTTAVRMSAYERHALPLASSAASDAIRDAGISAARITHLITVSCTGFHAPGLDAGLIDRLGLSRSVQRLNVGFMGCHGALNGLQAARAIVESNPAANVLLCAVELCSLHFSYGWNQERVVANGLFSDGAAALVAGSREKDSMLSLVGSGTYLFPDSRDAMTWNIGDHGFAMTLSIEVPRLLEANLRAWVVEWLGLHDCRLKDVPSWAIHPGGPKILSSVEKALGLTRAATLDSHEVLREYGNMSSPTVLFILASMIRRRADRPIAALAFGPGLTVEGALFR